MFPCSREANVRTHDEIYDAAREGRAFSNSTSWEIWSYNWCQRCLNDINEDCPIVNVAMLGEKTPEEWVGAELHDYECTEFEPQEEEQ
jgi:hypothetical protein